MRSIVQNESKLRTEVTIRINNNKELSGGIIDLYITRAKNPISMQPITEMQVFTYRSSGALIDSQTTGITLNPSAP